MGEEVTMSAFISLALPFLGGLVGAGISGVVTWNVAKRQLEVQQDNNQLISVLKVAEFRVAWIQSLRDELTDLQSNAFSERQGVGLPPNEFLKPITKIQLLMNPDDEDYDALVVCMKTLLESTTDDGKLDPLAAHELTKLSQGILKREWDRARQDIRDRRIIDEPIEDDQ